jgi:HK97 family phage portal protein
MITSVINDAGVPVEVAPGRGDLRYGSLPFVFNLRRSLNLVDRQVSFARLFCEQPMVASAAGWLMKQARRVPLKAYRRTGDDSRQRLFPEDHPLAAAIEEPWERASQQELVAALLGPVLVHGNAITEIQKARSEAISFIPYDWRYALPMMPWRGSIAGWEVDRDHPSTFRTVAADNMVHVATWSPLGPLGVSPLEQLGVTIAIEDAAQRHQRAILANGARPPSAILASAEFLGLKADERKELMENLREDIDDIYAGPENSGRPALLPPGLTWEATAHTSVEVELIEQRKIDRLEAFAVYGVMPGVLGVIERTPELEQQRLMSYTDGLAPPLILVETAINSQVVAGILHEDDVFVEFDFAGILRGDKLKEIEAIRDAIATAVMTPNEGRTILNLPREAAEGMDEFYLPRNNLIPVDVPYKAKGMGEGGVEPGEEAESGTGAEAEPTPAGSPSEAAPVQGG